MGSTRLPSASSRCAALQDMAPKVQWPITLFRFQFPDMVVEDATDRSSGFAVEFFERGTLLPVLTTASGRVFLAYSSQRVRRDPRTRLPRRPEETQSAWADLAALERDLAATRERGFAKGGASAVADRAGQHRDPDHGRRRARGGAGGALRLVGGVVRRGAQAAVAGVARHRGTAPPDAGFRDSRRSQPGSAPRADTRPCPPSRDSGLPPAVLPPVTGGGAAVTLSTPSRGDVGARCRAPRPGRLQPSWEVEHRVDVGVDAEPSHQPHLADVHQLGGAVTRHLHTDHLASVRRRHQLQEAARPPEIGPRAISSKRARLTSAPPKRAIVATSSSRPSRSPGSNRYPGQLLGELPRARAGRAHGQAARRPCSIAADASAGGPITSPAA